MKKLAAFAILLWVSMHAPGTPAITASRAIDGQAAPQRTQPPSTDGKLNIIAFGAHLGHRVRFVSVTNGDAGHQTEGGGALAARRRAEAQEAGRRIGIEYVVLDNHDGELLPTLKPREEIIRQIRQWNATHSMFEWSDEMTTVERYERVGNDMVAELTLYDPVAFVQPLHTKLRYTRSTRDERPVYSTCSDTNGPSSNIFTGPDGVTNEKVKVKNLVLYLTRRRKVLQLWCVDRAIFTSPLTT